MKFNQQLDSLERLHHLIRRKQTGTLEELAEKFGVCVGTIKNMLRILKSRNLPIAYDYDRHTYYYTYEVEVVFFEVKAKEDLRKIRGGENNLNFFSESQNFCLTPYDLCIRLTNNGGQNDACGFGFSGFGY